MNLKEKLLSDMKEAMKSKDSLKLGTIRSVIAAVKNQEIDLRKDLDEEDVLTIVSREVKKRKEAASLYKKGRRPELEDQRNSGNENFANLSSRASFGGRFAPTHSTGD